jgi:hypothetical protein
MQQHSQLTGYGYGGPFLGVFSAAFGQVQAPITQMTVLTEGA